MKRPKPRSGRSSLLTFKRQHISKVKKYDSNAARAKHARRRAKAELKKKQGANFRSKMFVPTFFEFTKDVRENAVKLHEYIMGERCKKSYASKVELLREFRPSDAPFLSVNNPEARIKFRTVWRHHVEAWGGNQKCHFVTMVPKIYVVPLLQAPDFNVFELQQWTAQAMRGFDFVGIVEIAYYSNGGINDTPVISFHVHLIVYGADEAALFIRRDDLNKRCDALVAGRPAVKVQPITPGTLGTTAEYLAKESIGETRVYEKKGTWHRVAVTEDGELDIDNVHENQNKAPARPGVQLKIREVTKGMHFDKLIFAGGGCGSLLMTIRRDLLSPLPWSKRKDRQSRYSGCFEGRLLARHDPNGWISATSGFHHEYFDDVEARVRLFCDPDVPEWTEEELKQHRANTVVLKKAYLKLFK